MNEDSCVFCRIAQKQVPASLVYEDEQVVAFLDIRPLNEGHTLVISKSHYENVFDVPEKLNAYIHGVTKQIAIAVKKATNADGISIVQQNGKAANQDVPHLHVHVIPRYEGQKMPSFSETSEANREQLSQTATKIRKNLLNPANAKPATEKNTVQANLGVYRGKVGLRERISSWRF
jgi:histidine triad (HIT) family protein